MWRILVMTDDSELERQLRGGCEGRCEVLIASTLEEAVSPDVEPHAIVVHAEVVGEEWLATIQALRRAHPEQEIVVLAATESDEGALEALRAGADDIFDPGIDRIELLDHITTLCSMREGSESGLRLAKKRLREEKKKRERELEHLHDLALGLTSSLDPDKVVAIGCERISALADLDACGIFLVEEGSDRMVLREPYVLDDGLTRTYVDLPVASEVSATPVTVDLTGDEAKKLPANMADSLRQAGLGSVAMVPLRAQDSTVGMLTGGRKPGRPFSEDDVQLLVAAATSVGLALDNARLYVDLRRSYARLVDTQAELVRAEKMAALGELSATVAHEVRNPLAAIYNSLSQLKRLIPSEGDTGVLLGIAQEEATRLNRIIGDLLQFARPGAPDLRPTSLADVLNGALRAARQDEAAREEVRVSVEYTPEDLLALCDASRLRQALVNLLINAFQAIDGAGNVQVRAAPGEDRNLVEIVVEDDGPGMTEEVRARAFDPFYTTRPAGSGLGLAIVRRVIEDQRGTVDVSSQEGAFTRFEIRLPRAEEEVFEPKG